MKMICLIVTLLAAIFLGLFVQEILRIQKETRDDN